MVGELIGDIPSGWIVARIGERNAMLVGRRCSRSSGSLTLHLSPRTRWCSRSASSDRPRDRRVRARPAGVHDDVRAGAVPGAGAVLARRDVPRRLVRRPVPRRGVIELTGTTQIGVLGARVAAPASAVILLVAAGSGARCSGRPPSTRTADGDGAQRGRGARRPRSRAAFPHDPRAPRACSPGWAPAPRWSAPCGRAGR